MSSEPKKSFSPPTTRLPCVDGEIVRHDGPLYFAKGNVVLLSEPQYTSTGTVVVAFKVYKEHLALQSPVFDGLFQRLLPPSDSFGEYDDTPVVPLFDSAANLVPFLSAIYDPTALPSKRDFYISLNEVWSVFMLCRKYKCDTLLLYMQNTLSELWPQDVPSWDVMSGKDYAVLLHGEDEGEDWVDEHGSGLPDPYVAVQLARHFNVHAVLPAAFYEVFRRSCVDASSRAQDTSLQGGGGSQEDEDEEDSVAHRLASLAPDDLSRVVRGSHAIRVFSANLFGRVRRVAREHNAACENGCRGECHEGMQRLMRKHKKLLFLKGDVLEWLKEWSVQSSKPAGCEVCGKCLIWYVVHMDEERLRFWETLPTYFGLAGNA